MKFRLGVNYWPSSSAMRWWKRFDYDEVARDFARLSAVGCDSVRFFLLWEDFQPRPDHVATPMLDLLAVVADAAAAENLSIIPTLYTGHMSGVNWIPEWAIDPAGPPGRFRVVAGDRVVPGAPKNWFENRQVREAQALLAHEVAATLRAHPALWAYDLGNENSNCCVPATRESGLAWLRAVAGAIRDADPVHPITLGLHMEDLEEDRKIGPAEAAVVSEFLCMHGYPIYARWAHGPTDALLLPFLTLVTGWLGWRAVLFEEFGVPTEVKASALRGMLLSEESAARYTRDALSQLRRFGAIGAMVWCCADYVRELWPQPPLDEAPHERSFGLWRSDGSPKPAVNALTEAQSWERLQATIDLSWIDMRPEDYYLAPLDNLKRLYGRFTERYRLR